MCIDADEEKGSAVCVKVTNKSTVIYISANMGYGRESSGNVGCIMYREEKSCEDL